jgi:hypothetical protein
MVIRAEVNGFNQSPVAVHCRRTEEPGATSVGVALMVIDRVAAWLLPAERITMTSPMKANLIFFLLLVRKNIFLYVRYRNYK